MNYLFLWSACCISFFVISSCRSIALFQVGLLLLHVQCVCASCDQFPIAASVKSEKWIRYVLVFCEMWCPFLRCWFVLFSICLPTSINFRKPLHTTFATLLSLWYLFWAYFNNPQHVCLMARAQTGNDQQMKWSSGLLHCTAVSARASPPLILL